MGWSSGKGLGANEQGAADVIKLDANSDRRGWFKRRYSYHIAHSNLNMVGKPLHRKQKDRKINQNAFLR